MSTESPLNKGDMSVILKKLDSLSNDLNEVRTCLTGSEKFGQVGLVHKVESLQKDNERDKATKNKIIGGFVVVSFFWAFIVDILKHRWFGS